MAEIKTLLTVDDLMAVLGGVSRTYVQTLTRENRITYRLEGGALRFHPEHVEEYLDRNNRGFAPSAATRPSRANPTSSETETRPTPRAGRPRRARSGVAQ